MPPVRLDRMEINKELSTLDNWTFDTHEARICKTWEFNSFKAAMSFISKVGDMAELHDHHPEFLSSYTRVRIRLSTHDAHGLTHKDFDLARSIDHLVSHDFPDSSTIQ